MNDPTTSITTNKLPSSTVNLVRRLARKISPNVLLVCSDVELTLPLEARACASASESPSGAASVIRASLRPCGPLKAEPERSTL